MLRCDWTPQLRLPGSLGGSEVARFCFKRIVTQVSSTLCEEDGCSMLFKHYCLVWASSPIIFRDPFYKYHVGVTRMVQESSSREAQYIARVKWWVRLSFSAWTVTVLDLAEAAPRKARCDWFSLTADTPFSWFQRKTKTTQNGAGGPRKDTPMGLCQTGATDHAK